ncbi:MAG: hypothetical protein IJB17_04300 [Oscillospiraceae bacterium]|nr:hypothetical protein [Oscillospiraceae bacterium]
MILESLRKDKAYRLNFTTITSLTLNGIYAVGNIALGAVNDSIWFIALGAFFLVLCITRGVCLSALHSKSRKRVYVGRLSGLLLIVLCITLIFSVVLSDRMDVVTPIHEIIMIAIAAFTTAKTITAVVNTVKANKAGDPILIALRNISLADAAASILSMQRSMLVSFGEMPVDTAKLMNLLTGIGVCLFIFALGILSYKTK